MSNRDLPRVLCVDDEARVVESLVLRLRRFLFWAIREPCAPSGVK
jgi:hypothetical protein